MCSRSTTIFASISCSESTLNMHNLSYSSVQRISNKMSLKCKLVPKPINKLPAVASLEPDLPSIRVIQRNLIYIKNIPASIATEKILTQAEYFGQYGSIQKCIIVPPKDSAGASCKAYITYATPQQALLSITACNQFPLGPQTLQITFGTTRYCTYFISNQKCPRKGCFFLHQRQPDCQISGQQALKQAAQSLIITVVDRSSCAVLPALRLSSKQQSKQSRFRFAQDGRGEGLRNDPFERLAMSLSPSESTAQLSSDQYQKLDSWAGDVLCAVLPLSDGAILISGKTINKS